MQTVFLNKIRKNLPNKKYFPISYYIFYGKQYFFLKIPVVILKTAHDKKQTERW
jgi:hypothetical protein